MSQPDRGYATDTPARLQSLVVLGAGAFPRIVVFLLSDIGCRARRENDRSPVVSIRPHRGKYIKRMLRAR